MQKEDYERKLGELSSRLESIETGMKSAEEKEEEKNNNENTQMEELDKLKEEMSAKFEDVCTKVEKMSCFNVINVYQNFINFSHESSRVWLLSFQYLVLTYFLRKG